MKKVLISVYDKLAGIYSAPIVEPNVDVAIRNFVMGIRNNQMIMSNPDDFHLVIVGFFNDQPSNSEHIVSSSISDLAHGPTRIPVSQLLDDRPDTFVEDLKNK